ncbi:MAG: hypothetical protein FWE95_05290 [Planctomycetaceae bacterium]|nr:hypothetical protein [Planctomycetaceae bacterium]
MTVNEARDWRRYIMIRGPIGERRLDDHLNWLRQALFASQGGKRTIEECSLKYSYKSYFQKDAEDELEEVVANIDKDIDNLVSRFGNRKNNKTIGRSVVAH